jgi:putative transposase
MYRRLLRDHAKRFELRILSYCLMTNRVYLVAIPEQGDSFAKGLGRIHNDYARWFHLKHGRTGHLCQNRFFSCPLEESHLADTLRYLELNPVRAGLVDTAWEWRWSSASARIAAADPAGFL